MTFDPVHDTQAVHRALVRAFSFPGVPASIVSPSERCAALELPDSLVAVALTLLDPQTSFFSSQASFYTQRTGARMAPHHDAAFVFAEGWHEETWASAFRTARQGTLADPQDGASVVTWSAANVPGQMWMASGPGIETSLEIQLPGEGTWVEARQRACVEFPLGVDWIWARDDGTVIALPRTTRLMPADRKGA